MIVGAFLEGSGKSGMEMKFDCLANKMRVFLAETGWLSHVFLVCVLCK